MDNWKHIGSPVMGVLQQVEKRMAANKALEASAILMKSDNPLLRIRGCEQLVEFDRLAEQQQLGE